MRRWRKGYFSIEASIIMPIVLFLYLIIILTTLYLYCRCAISQDTFLLGMRAGGFTYGAVDYGEVIYGGQESENWSVCAYVEERLVKRKNIYPVYSYTEGNCTVDEENVYIQTTGSRSGGIIQKRILRRNPVAMIREGRRN